MDVRKVTGNEPVLIDLGRVEESPGPYCMSFGFDMEPLTSSIDAFGLINLPFVILNNKGLFDPVMGYRRFMALKTLRWDKVPCMDLSNAGLSPIELLLMNLHDNLSMRRLNNVEKGMVIARLNRYLPKEEIRDHYFHLLGLSNPFDFEVWVRIEDLSEKVKKAITEGSVSMHSLNRLMDTDKKSFFVVIEKIIDLRLNFNQQMKFIDYINDISIIDNRPAWYILEEKSILDLLNEKRMNKPQKAKKLLELLRIKRFPFLSSNEKSFKKMIDQMNLPAGIRLQHPPFFESADYRLEILFKNGMDLEKKIEQLAQKKDIAKIKDPWEQES